MTAEMLTLSQVAEYEKISYITVKKKNQRGQIKSVKLEPVGEGNPKYLVSPSELSLAAQRRYVAQLKEQGLPLPDELAAAHPAADEKYKDMTLTGLTQEQRDEVAFWVKIVKDWQAAVADNWKEQTKATQNYVKFLRQTHPDRKISERTLRRKWKLYQEHGEVALTDLRKQASNKGTNSIDEKLLSVFLQWWLDENKPKATELLKLLKSWAEDKHPELLPIPSQDTFYRAIKKVPVPVVKFFRYGAKEYSDECEPYMIRIYETLTSNEIWSADYHTLDFFVRDDVSGKVFRPHLIVWIDIRSRKILSWSVRESSDSDGAFISFRRAVRDWGVPEKLYLDNGREFLASDFGGRGVRKTDANANYGTTILERLLVDMHNAIPGNAKAKVIERKFRDLTNDFSRLIKTYTGGKPEERPHRLQEILKDETNIPLLSQVREWLGLYIEGWYNEQPSQAAGLDGLSPNQCYAQNLIKKRTAKKDELDLMMLRTERLQTVDRNGVWVKVSGEKVWYSNDILVAEHAKKTKVYVYYDPEEMRTVRVCDEREVFLMEAEIVDTVNYDFGSETTKEAIHKLNSRKKAQKKLVQGFMDNLESIIEAPEAKDVLIEAAMKNIEQAEHDYEAKVLEPLGFVRKLKKASGSPIEPLNELIDWNEALDRFK